MPVAETELHYGSAYELLVATILSAQCTDKRVNMTTPALFERFPTPQAMAEALRRRYFRISRAYPTRTTRRRTLRRWLGNSWTISEEWFRTVWRSSRNFPAWDGRQQRGRFGGVSPGGDGSGYACFPRIAQTRTDPECQDALAGRTAAYGAYPFVAVAEGTPLADTPRPLCLYGPPSAVRYLRRAQMVSESGRSGGESGSCSDGEGVNPPLVYSWSLGYLCGNVSTNHTI